MYDTYLFRTRRANWNRYRLRIRQQGLARAIAGGVARRLVRAKAPAPNGQSGIGQFATPSRDEFTRVVKALEARGTRVGLMISGSFLELYNYAGQFREAFEGSGIEDRVSVDFLPWMGHNATLMDDQAEFMLRIAGWTLQVDRQLRGDARA
jgi:hypothetical protein